MDSIRDILAARGITIPEGIKTPMSSESLSERDRAIENAKVMNAMEGSLTDYDCPLCKNRGYNYIVSENNEIVARKCKCRPVRAELRRIKASGLEKLGKKCTFRTFKADEKWQKRLKDVGKAYVADSTKSWFFLGGQPGSGKTHICTAIGMELLKNGKAVRYMVWPEDLQKLKAYINDISFEHLIEPYKTVDVLYIDDFFKVRRGEQISTADVNMAIRIINHRYNAELVTIISSELSLAQIVELDEALGSRIAELTEDKYNNFIDYDIRKNYRFGKKVDV